MVSLATALPLSSRSLAAQAEFFREGILTRPINDCNLTMLRGNMRSSTYAATTYAFYDVPQGDMDVNCTGASRCYRPSGTYGVLSTSTAAYSKAYGTTTGYDLATGLGTLDAYNLVTKWTSVTP
jgi:hypothetical protein